MRETSLDEFVDRDGGGGDGSSEADGSESEDGRESEPAADSGPDSEPEQEEGSEPGAEPEPEPGAELESGPEPDSGSGPDSEPELDRELDAVEPAVSTYDWTPTGADCEACGTAVERRWRDDGRLVCADCKAW